MACIELYGDVRAAPRHQYCSHFISLSLGIDLGLCVCSVKAP